MPVGPCGMGPAWGGRGKEAGILVLGTEGAEQFTQ